MTARNSERKIRFSIVILTFNRSDELLRSIDNISMLSHKDIEVLVVDNASKLPAKIILAKSPNVRVLTEPTNRGVSARNAGFSVASGDIIICLDDDVYGLDDEDLSVLDELFGSSKDLGAVCFRVLDEETGKVTNWVHKRDVRKYASRRFFTYEITEGAVAFRASALNRTKYYPASFFISHEGPDLALRIMNLDFRIIYEPRIVVVHSHSEIGRTSWRRYYYDTRNIFWLAIRNLPVLMGIRVVARQAIGMLLYAIRDGYFLWWLKGVIHGFAGLRRELRARQMISSNTLRRIKQIKKEEQSIARQIRHFFSGKLIGR